MKRLGAAVVIAGLMLGAPCWAQQGPFIGVSPGTSTSSLLSSVINIATSGNTTVIPGTTGKVTRVYALTLTAASPVSATFQNGVSIALSGPMNLVAGVPLTLPFTSQPYFTTSAGNDFVINLSAGGVEVAGTAYYQQR